MYCDHGRTAATCEQCAHARGVAAGRVSPASTLYPPDAAPRPRAARDLDIPLAEGITVRVRAGDPIPDLGSGRTVELKAGDLARDVDTGGQPTSPTAGTRRKLA